MAEQTIYLITGANRGIGRGIVEALLLRPNTTIIASVRDLTSPTSVSLSTLPTGPNSVLIPIQISATDDLSPSLALSTLQQSHNITHIDTVIANAGISKFYAPIAVTPLSEIRDHYEINLVGTMALFQAVYPFLQKAKEGRFVAVSTGGATIGGMEGFPVPAGAYCMSKVALNFAVRKIHFECEELVAFVISPGWVQTEMGNFGATSVGMEEAPVQLEDSIKGILGKIDASTRESMGGTFQSFDETQYLW